jgi:hypothetical protein
LIYRHERDRAYLDLDRSPCHHRAIGRGRGAASRGRERDARLTAPALETVRPTNKGKRTMVDLPVVCTLAPETIATRKAGLLPGLVRRADSREDILDGVRFRFPGNALSAVATTVDAERQCCRFVRFNITVEPDGGPISLTLSGPPGTREFLSALLES